MQPDEYLQAIKSSSLRIATIARENSGVEVPCCDGWTVKDLLVHVGGIHGWAAAILASKERVDARPKPDSEQIELIVQWAERQTEDLIAALEDSDLDEQCWTFGLPRTGRFWLRRMALETSAHAWDAQRAIGSEAVIESELAADGVDEFLDLMLARIVKGVPDQWNGESIHLHRTDGPGEWIVTLGPGGSVEFERAHRKGDLAVRATASDLYLWCLNRIGIDRLDHVGDMSVASRWAATIGF